MPNHPGSAIPQRAAITVRSPCTPGPLTATLPIPDRPPALRMILPSYKIAPSLLPGAGQGLFLTEPVAAGRIITAPDAIDRTWTGRQLAEQPELAGLQHASARWFEDRYTVSPDWPDECYLNHSFEPTGLWHLGFVFATADLPAGCEITIDYRHLLPPGISEDFADAITGQTITGWSWTDSLRISTETLAALLSGVGRN